MQPPIRAISAGHKPRKCRVQTMKEVNTMKVKYQKPKIISCRDCVYMKKCMEWSRLTPCRDFRQKEET